MVVALQTRTRYSVRSRATTRNAVGERTSAYAHKFYVLGSTPIHRSSALLSEAGAIRTEDRLRIRAVYRAGVEMGDQLVDDGGRVYYVSQALDDGGIRRWLDLTVSERPALGP